MKTVSKFLLLSMIAFLSCDTDENIKVEPGDLSYFPLEVGYEWVYEPISKEHQGTLAVTFKVVSQESKIGQLFYAMERRYERENGSVSSDTIFYRVDAQGFVYETSRYNQAEVNRFRLGADDGYQWEMDSWTDDKYKVTTSTTEVSLQRETLTDCKSFSYDIPQWIDEEHYIILAKGIGIVQHGNAWGFNFRLKSAQLGATTK